MASSKDLKPLMKRAKQQGWTITQSRGGHLKWLAKSGGVYFSSRTPSDSRAVKNLEKDLMKMGLT